MKKEKYYFENEDSETCYPLSYHKEIAKQDGLKEIELIEAIPDLNNPEYIWCGVHRVCDKLGCNKDCTDYKGVKNKGCEHKGKLFEHGDFVRFKVE